MVAAAAKGNQDQWRNSILTTLLLATVLATSLILFAQDMNQTGGQLQLSSSSSLALRRNDYGTVDEQRKLLLVLDPKTVEPRVPPTTIEADDADADRERTLDLLKRTEDYWIRWEKHTRYPETVAEIESARSLLAELDARRSTLPPIEVCGRSFSRTDDGAAPCPTFDAKKPLLLVTGPVARGRTGNNLVELLHAVQYARDEGLQLGIMSDCWATRLATHLWAANREGPDRWAGGAWQAEMEEIFCAKIFNAPEELEGLAVVDMSTQELFGYRTTASLGEYMAAQMGILQRLYARLNNGEGTTRSGFPASDMCSVVDAVFANEEERRSAVYSVVHSRSMNGNIGRRHLAAMARHSGCDPVAALEMKPEYVKSVLGPLNMLKRPIVFIGDGENREVLERLLADPDLGPLMRVVPPEASFIGGDITLAVASNVFMGNPASSFSNFIVKSRMALGMGHNAMFRARDRKTKAWKTVCGDHCTFALCP